MPAFSDTATITLEVARHPVLENNLRAQGRAVVPLSLTNKMGVDAAAMIITWTISTLVSYGGTTVLITALAVIFRRLTNWREGVPLA